MNTVNDGGPAFPVTASTGYPRDGVYCRDGMSLRDWFAGQALVGITSLQSDFDAIAKHVGMSAEDLTARACFVIADAMLKARGGQ